jgi:hypothetical protein
MTQEIAAAGAGRVPLNLSGIDGLEQVTARMPTAGECETHGFALTCPC